MTVERVAMPDVAGVTHQRIDVGGLSVHVAEAGSKPAAVLLHGWPQNWFCCDQAVSDEAGRSLKDKITDGFGGEEVDNV